NSAVSVCVPTGNDPTPIVAVEFFGTAAPKEAAASFNVTMPAGNGGGNEYAPKNPASGVTTTLNVFGCPAEITGYFEVRFTAMFPAALMKMAMPANWREATAITMRPSPLKSAAATEPGPK